MTPFASATALERSADDRFVWMIPDGWQQGRGAWGGLVVAAIVRAVEATEPEPARVVRSLSVQIMAPAVVGAHVLEVRSVRIGSAMSTWDVTMSAESGEAVARGLVICGSGRSADGFDHASWGVLTAPDAPPPDDSARLPGPPLLPTFMQHLYLQPIDGIPLSGGPAASLGWVGYDVATTLDAAALLALVDGWYPASLPVVDRMPRIATVTFTANLLVAPGSIAPGELLLNQSFVAGATDGFTSEHRRLWTSDGRLAVDNVQTIVVGA